MAGFVFLLVVMGSLSAWAEPSPFSVEALASSPQDTVEINAVARDGSPESVTELFYRWYVDGGAAEIGRYRESDYLAAPMVRRVDALVASGEIESLDPFYCSPLTPSEIRVGLAEVVGHEATVAVTTALSDAQGQRFLVALEQDGQVWRIVNVSCGTAQATRGSGLW
jgi:hypothetical protein